MPRILALTDLHRGFSRATPWIHEKLYTNLANEQFDVLIVSGDHASTQQVEVKEAYAAYRTLAGDRPVVTTDGNHCYWNNPRVMPWDAEQQHREWAKEQKVHRLEDGPYLHADDGTLFVGWMGWYRDFPQSNDFRYWIPLAGGEYAHVHNYFKEKETREFHSACLFAENHQGPVIAVTHFPITEAHHHAGNPEHFSVIAPHIQALIYGHSHIKHYEERDGVLIVNVGSDYDDPKYALFDLDTKFEYVKEGRRFS